MWRPQGWEDRSCISHTIIGNVFNMLMGMSSHNVLRFVHKRFVHKLKLTFVLQKFLPNFFLLLTQLNVVSNRLPHLPVIDWPIPVFKIISKSMYNLLLHFSHHLLLKRTIYWWKISFTTLAIGQRNLEIKQTAHRVWKLLDVKKTTIL